jgi:hypothetical protein
MHAIAAPKRTKVYLKRKKEKMKEKKEKRPRLCHKLAVSVLLKYVIFQLLLN